jgi:hypothetical protein
MWWWNHGWTVSQFWANNNVGIFCVSGRNQQGYLETLWSAYRIVESGDLLEKLLILLLGVTILGRGARPANAARGGEICELRWLELLYPERREAETCELSEELIYPEEESYESEIPESECDSTFFSELFSKLFSEFFSSPRCVHSSPHPRDVERRGIGSRGVIGRSLDAWLSSDGLSGKGFLLTPVICVTTSIFSVSNGFSLSKDDARDTLRSNISSPKELSRQVIFFVIRKKSGI